MQTLNDFKRLLGDISNLQYTIGIKPNELINLSKTLDVEKDLKSPRKLSVEARDLALVEGNYRRHMWIVWL